MRRRQNIQVSINGLVVTHHKSTQTVAKHAADSDIENYVDAGFEQVMDEFDVDFVLGGHDHGVFSKLCAEKRSEKCRKTG